MSSGQCTIITQASLNQALFQDSVQVYRFYMKKPPVKVHDCSAITIGFKSSSNQAQQASSTSREGEQKFPNMFECNQKNKALG
eukprot:1159535-Pelagomonas_calceolata.AAC.2